MRDPHQVGLNDASQTGDEVGSLARNRGNICGFGIILVAVQVEQLAIAVNEISDETDAFTVQNSDITDRALW